MTDFCSCPGDMVRLLKRYLGKISNKMCRDRYYALAASFFLAFIAGYCRLCKSECRCCSSVALASFSIANLAISLITSFLSFVTWDAAVFSTAGILLDSSDLKT
ncbi:hypothetical protein F5Y02DRAFT_360824 [Annulohypoxylon stygium]|nr:hypothetical protein F5Y02DRAFT_360824 [Annulohypoxylon stygium]